ncbi:Na+/H+ antiporter NhaC family protein [Bifidobacterium scardovii]|uniref:Na+/H+ antiporter NhaC family protein n=1 Tax=Bifidobacterium scardovii TaxID=158787 RepID=UPI0005B56516|nr:Na+/H+ antiporter NhaC family protein [Bifidobacterium scardovii]MDK6349595.1 Na+/H+ antiporter NhaC family protein [Bifidobacterium scardovii]MDU8981756.1 Na+/H+ antiporter NhaC family protein [Bifidobacterium scardovii]BAQ30871.1 sodium-hydrogen antiporter [Bifidobacterium scardovii JCM 12489 = DSM 13734]
MVPAVLVIVLALLRVDVRMTMLASIAGSLAVCVGMQGMGVRALARLLVFGYDSPNPRIDALLGGGGLLSMISVAAIVCISSAYAGIFAQTGMLLRLQRAIGVMGRRIGASGAMAVTAACTAAFACNQTLTIMLTHQLCEGLYARPNGGAVRADRNGQAMAVDLEDTAVVIAPLIPWSIAGALPLTTINAPTVSLAAACFLYLLPLSRLVAGIRKGIRKGGSHGKTAA